MRDPLVRPCATSTAPAMFGMWRSKREQTRLQRLGQERRVKGLERQVRALAVLQRRGPSITGSYELTRGLGNGVYEGEVLCAPGPMPLRYRRTHQYPFSQRRLPRSSRSERRSRPPIEASSHDLHRDRQGHRLAEARTWKGKWQQRGSAPHQSCPEPESGYWTARSTNSTRYSYRTAGWVAAKRLDFSPRAGPDSWHRTFRLAPRLIPARKKR